jgi:AcrR family transcriptional regulator
MSNADTREVILTVASTLYATRGYEAVSMRDVAAEVRIKPASLYYHFKDKEALVRESLAYVFAEKTAPMEALLQAGSSPQERFEAFIAWFVRLIFEDPIFSRLLTRELLDGTAERLAYLSREVFDRSFSLLSRTIAEFSGSAEPALTAMSVVSMILGHYQLAGTLPHLSGSRVEYGDPEVLIRHFTELLVRALRSPCAGGESK